MRFKKNELSNVAPCFVVDDAPDSRFCKAEEITKLGHTYCPLGVFVSYCPYLFGRHLRACVALTPRHSLWMHPSGIMVASWRRSPALVVSVFHVVSLRSQEQMGRVDAGRVVAFMANAHALRNRTILQEPSYSVNKKDDPPDPKMPVTDMVTRSVPNPTLKKATMIYFSPETGDFLRLESRNATMVLRHGSLLDRGLCLERRAGQFLPVARLFYKDN